MSDSIAIICNHLKEEDSGVEFLLIPIWDIATNHPRQAGVILIALHGRRVGWEERKGVCCLAIDGCTCNLSRCL